MTAMATATAQALSDAAREFVEGRLQPLIIGGERVEATDGRVFETIDPATGEPICEVALGRRRGRRARRRRGARRRSRARCARCSPRSARGLMYALAELIKANGEQLAELESLDNGKPLAAAQGGHRATVSHLRYYAGWPTKIEGETIPVSAPRRPLSTRSASRSASAPRSSPGTTRS